MTGGRLAGIGVVITRPRAAAEALAAELEAEGARPIVFPCLAIEALAPSATLAAALDAFAQASLAIFVSANAVEMGLPVARAQGPWPQGAAVAAIGQATALALRNSGFAHVLSPAGRQDSDALLALEQMQAHCVSGQQVVIFRGVGGRERLRQELEARGARVSYVECYRRLRPPGDAAALLAAWSRDEVHAVSALSAETLENFVAMIGKEGVARLDRTILVVPHEAIAAHRDARRFAQAVVAEPGAAGIVQALSPMTASR